MRSSVMTINKKSLISTLQTAKKANVASAPLAEGGEVKGTKGVKLSRGVKLTRAMRATRATRAMKFRK
jgi:hypothetical protein